MTSANRRWFWTAAGAAVLLIASFLIYRSIRKESPLPQLQPGNQRVMPLRPIPRRLPTLHIEPMRTKPLTKQSSQPATATQKKPTQKRAIPRRKPKHIVPPHPISIRGSCARLPSIYRWIFGAMASPSKGTPKILCGRRMMAVIPRDGGVCIGIPARARFPKCTTTIKGQPPCSHPLHYQMKRITWTFGQEMMAPDGTQRPCFSVR